MVVWRFESAAALCSVNSTEGKRMVDTKTAVLSVRVAPADRDAIAALAVELGISQSELIVRRVLGRTNDAIEARFAETEARLERLERDAL